MSRILIEFLMLMLYELKLPCHHSKADRSA